MVRRLLMIGLCLAVPLSAAWAQPIRLAWNDCGFAGSSSESWSCNSNQGGNDRILVSSFVPPVRLTAFVGVTVILKIKAGSPLLPDWWRNAPTDCHNGYAVDVPSSVGLTSCADPWSNGGIGGGFDWKSGDGGPDRATVISDLARDSAVPLDAGIEYYAEVHRFRAVRSTGAAACGGCGAPVCVLLDEIQLFQVAGTPPEDVVYLRSDAQPAAVSWQSATCGISARKGSWGSLKTLYR